MAFFGIGRTNIRDTPPPAVIVYAPFGTPAPPCPKCNGAEISGAFWESRFEQGGVISPDHLRFICMRCGFIAHRTQCADSRQSDG